MEKKKPASKRKHTRRERPQGTGNTHTEKLTWQLFPADHLRVEGQGKPPTSSEWLSRDEKERERLSFLVGDRKLTLS